MSVSSIAILAILFFVTSIIGVVTGSNSLITVPVMFQFGVDPKMAVATNMFGLTFMAVGASVPFMRRGVIEYGRVTPLVVITVVGSAIGAALVGWITDEGIKLVVSAAMIVVAVFILVKRNAGTRINAERGMGNAEFETADSQIHDPRSKIESRTAAVATAPGSDSDALTDELTDAIVPRTTPSAEAASTPPQTRRGAKNPGSDMTALVYFLTFLLGIYGGLYSGGYVTILTAVYVAFFGMTFTEAVGSTKFINIFSSLVATVVFAWQGLIDYRLGIILAAAMFAGGYVGAHYAAKLNDLWIRRIFLAAVFLLAIKTLFDLLLG